MLIGTDAYTRVDDVETWDLLALEAVNFG